MKKLLSILTFLVALGFVAMFMYVLGIPPFHAGGPFYPAAPAPTQQTTQILPDFLSEEKISRNQTYSEHMNRGALLEQNGFSTLAIAEYQAANKQDPETPDPYIKIGRLHLLNQEYTEAEDSFRNALKIAPDNIDASIYLGRTLLMERKIDEARNMFNQITTDNQTIIYYRGILATYFGDYENSKKLLNHAIGLGTSADITKKAQNFLNAFSEFDSNQGGQQTHLKTLLARSYDQTGEYQMAIPLLFEVIKEEKDYRDAWIILGYAYLNIQKYQDAADALEQARKLDPQKPETFFFLGLSYSGLNDLQKAASNLEQAKKLGFQPTIQVEQKLAEIYYEMKQYDKSAQQYENVVYLNDQNINYYIRPIWLYIEKLNQPEKALTLAQRAFKNHPNQAMSYNLLAWAQMGNNQLDDAENNLRQALKLEPGLDAAYLNWGQLLEKREQFDKALALYVKAHDLGHGNGISNAAAERYNELIGKMKDLNITMKTNILNQ